MNKTMTACEAVEKVESIAAETWAARQARGMVERDCTALAVGDVMRQGDVYLIRVPNDWPRGKARTDRQLAPGSTQGSRHVAEEPFGVFDGVKLPDWFTAKGFAPGPVIVLAPGVGDGLVSHPEHLYSRHAADTTWQTSYQQDAATRQRVMD